MYGILLSRLGWFPYLLLGIVRQAAKTNKQDYCTFTCCFSWPFKKNFMAPFFMDGVQLPQGYSHFEEAVYFLPLAHCQNGASLSLFYRYYFGGCSWKLTQLVPLSFFQERSSCYSDRLLDFYVTTSRSYNDVYANSFFPYAAILLNSVPIECFPLT